MAPASRPPRQPTVARTTLATGANAGDVQRTSLAVKHQSSTTSDEDDHSSSFQAVQQVRGGCSSRVGRACSTDIRAPKADRKQLICQNTRVWFEEDMDTNQARSLSAGPTFAGSGDGTRNCRPPEAVRRTSCERQLPLPFLVPLADCNSARRRQAKRCCRSPRRLSHAGNPGSPRSGSRQQRLHCVAALTPRGFAIIRTRTETSARDAPGAQCTTEGTVKHNVRASSNPASEAGDQSCQRQRLVNQCEVWRPRGLA